MSMIGPRPLLPADLADDCSVRLSVVPGLTGWAQVQGGKAITADEKNALDEWYVYHASLALDLRIVWATLRIVFKGDARQDGALAVALAFREKRLRREARSQARREASAPSHQIFVSDTSPKVVEFRRPMDAPKKSDASRALKT